MTTVLGSEAVLGRGWTCATSLTHFAEAFDVMSWMRWGLEDSAGHYLDLGSAVLGLTLFPIGYLAHALSR